MTHVEKFQKELRSGQAALISSVENRFYLSLFTYHDGFLLVMPDKAYLLTDFRYAEAAEQKADRAFEILCPKATMFGAVAELMRAYGATELLFEENHLTVAARERLAEKLQDTGIDVHGGAGAILTRLRAYKDEAELAAMMRAQALTDAAFSHVLNILKPSMREIDVALELEYFMRREGAEGIAFHTIAVSGTASALPHGVPRNCVLEKGFLTMDFGARFGGYCADMTRTVVIGKADDEMKRLYDTVLKAQQAALDMAACGASCRALDLAARAVIDGAGYEGCFGHSLGHGVGVEVHEAPRLSAKAPENALLERGHIVTVEPGIYVKGKYGCRIEDMIAVMPSGEIYNFTKSRKDLIEI